MCLKKKTNTPTPAMNQITPASAPVIISKIWLTNGMNVAVRDLGADKRRGSAVIPQLLGHCTLRGREAL